MRRLLLTLIGLATAAVVSAQVFPITLPSHVIVDSCSGCGGGTVAIDQTTPGTTNGVAVTNVPHVVCDSGCGSAAAVLMADGVANPTIPQTASFGVVFNGTTWDRWRGDTTSGAWVQVKNTPAVTVSSGSITANAGTNLNTSALALDATVTGRLPAGASPADNESNTATNLSRVGTFPFVFDGTTWDRWTGQVTLGGTLPAFAATPTMNVGTFPDNEPINVAQLAGTATSVNSGVKDAGTLRVVLATDQPQLTNKLLVTPDANSAINVAQIAGAATSTAASGVQKVGLVGNAGAAIDAANNAAAPANVIVQGVETIAQGSQPTAATAGNVRRSLATTEGVMFVQEGSSNRFSCFVQAVTVTTQCQAAPGAGLRAYITGATFSNQAATVQTLDIVFGTGSNCATGITALTHKIQMGTNATTTSPFLAVLAFDTPLIPTAANAICVRPSAATAFGATLTGFIAP